MDRIVVSPKVCVIVVTWNKKSFVTALVGQLQGVNYPNYDIVVVDNASSDGTSEEIARLYPGVRMIRNSENLGGTGGFNTGLVHALQTGVYQYVWLLDDDVSISPDALLELVLVLEGNCRIGIAGSAMFDSSSPERLIEIGNFIDLKRGRFSGNCRYSDSTSCDQDIYFVDSVSACSMCVPVEAIMSVGIWDDYFFLYCDDVDWNIRFRKKGYLVAAVPKSKIWHMPWEFKSGFNTVYYATRNKLYLLNKHLQGFEKIFGLFYAQAAALYFSLRFIFKKQFFASLLMLQSVIDYLQRKSGKFADNELLARLETSALHKSYHIWLFMVLKITLLNVEVMAKVGYGRVAGTFIESARIVFSYMPWRHRLKIIKTINDFYLWRSQNHVR
ncbi:MAG: glycosyltransferase [Geobacter sp.]|nr:glycosyltransferase [Geobacter sp.]